jgi:hypothetical protein
MIQILKDGMRWDVSNAQYVLSLCAKWKSCGPKSADQNLRTKIIGAHLLADRLIYTVFVGAPGVPARV